MGRVFHYLFCITFCNCYNTCQYNKLLTYLVTYICTLCSHVFYIILKIIYKFFPGTQCIMVEEFSKMKYELPMPLP